MARAAAAAVTGAARHGKAKWQPLRARVEIG
jgi:hypothetical protein